MTENIDNLDNSNALTAEPSQEGNVGIIAQSCNNPACTFFEYLEKLGLDFNTEAVEDFLLSLKAKQFLILSGGTGTGKTRLAKAYGEFISNPESRKIAFRVGLGKSATDGFTLSTSTFFDSLPSSANKYSGLYRFKIGNVEADCEIELAPRFWYSSDDPDVKLAKDEVVEMGKTQKNGKLYLIIPANTDSEKKYIVVPVGSDWSSNRQILGYRNAITEKYTHTPPLDFILRSNEHEAYPYLLILDEMNLSHAERYFADVLSSMESKEPILLDSAGDAPSSVYIGDNLFIIGTVNMDETTHMLSPKILDRANVLEFEPTSIMSYVSSGNKQIGPRGDVEFLQDCMSGIGCRMMNGKEIITAMLKEKSNKDILDSIVKDLDSIQAIMSKMKLPFGFRTFDEVMRFMYVAWTYEGRGAFTNWKRYFDAQIKQKVLPKIHGNSSITVPLKELQTFCAGNGYPRSASKLEKMEAVLSSQRYVSFNC